MSLIFKYTIPTEADGQNAASYLKKLGYSRHLLIPLKKSENGIRLNGCRIKASQILRNGDELVITMPKEIPSEHIQPVPLPLSVVYEDSHLLVVDKAAGMAIHPSIHHYDNTLANGLVSYFQSKGEDFVFRCINRLDSDTSGLLIVAKHQLSASILSAMVKKRQIHREYLAIVEGNIKENGTIHAPIGRKDGSILERCVDFQSGDDAITHYRKLAFHDGYSLISVKLETGRTHQIRVHLAYLGHPLAGDFLYNPDSSIMKRQALHSHRLSFSHPITGESMTFEAPLPHDMKWF